MMKMKDDSTPTRNILFAGRGLVALGVLVSLLLIGFGTYRDGKEVIIIDASARGTFEAHLLALDEERWDDAAALVVDRCIVVPDYGRANAVREDLRRSGHTFTTAFDVGEVWYNENGEEVLLELRTPPRLPLPGIATMELTDEGWKVAC